MARKRKGKQYLENSSWVEKLCEGKQMEDANKRSIEILKEKQSMSDKDHFPYTKVHIGIEKFEKKS